MSQLPPGRGSRRRPGRGGAGPDRCIGSGRVQANARSSSVARRPSPSARLLCNHHRAELSGKETSSPVACRKFKSAAISLFSVMLISGQFMSSPAQQLVVNLSESEFPDDASIVERRKLLLSRYDTKAARFCMVHVGKTAGSSVACEVERFQYPELFCRNKVYPSALKKSFAGRTHTWGGRKECERTAFNAFLYTLRNPLDRLISWYYFEHPRTHEYPTKWRQCGRGCRCATRLFHKWEKYPGGCFDTLDDFARNATPPTLGGNNTNATSSSSSSCRELAFDVARGAKECAAHNGFGYAYYNERIRTLSNANGSYAMLAIRSEHLADDWDKLEHEFGGTGEVNGTVRFQTKSGTVLGSDRAKRELSEEGRLNLCSALCEEIQVYKRLLLQAQNLDNDQVRQSISEVIAVCPDETFGIRDC